MSDHCNGCGQPGLRFVTHICPPPELSNRQGAFETHVHSWSEPQYDLIAKRYKQYCECGAFITDREYSFYPDALSPVPEEQP